MPTTKQTRRPDPRPKRKAAAKKKAAKKKAPKRKAAKKRGRGGRPKVSKDKLELICLAISQGATMANACRVLGVGYETLNRYKKTAATQLEAGKSSSHEIDFVIELEKAEAQCINLMRKRIYDHSFVDWRAAAHLLKGLEPDVWNQRFEARAKVDPGQVAAAADGKGGGGVEISLVVSQPVDESPFIDTEAKD